MSNIVESDRKLNEMILNGKGMDAFEEFYAHDCTMQENKEAPIVGKDANRKREHDFMKTVEAVHGGRVVSSAVTGDTSFSEWEFEMTIKGVGRVKMEQVAVRKWRDGKVVAERFYHNP
jgi:ketosteroid isomerase-like protein